MAQVTQPGFHHRYWKFGVLFLVILVLAVYFAPANLFANIFGTQNSYLRVVLSHPVPTGASRVATFSDTASATTGDHLYPVIDLFPGTLRVGFEFGQTSVQTGTITCTQAGQAIPAGRVSFSQQASKGGFSYWEFHLRDVQHNDVFDCQLSIPDTPPLVVPLRFTVLKPGQAIPAVSAVPVPTPGVRTAQVNDMIGEFDVTPNYEYPFGNLSFYPPAHSDNCGGGIPPLSVYGATTQSFSYTTGNTTSLDGCSWEIQEFSDRGDAFLVDTGSVYSRSGKARTSFWFRFHDANGNGTLSVSDFSVQFRKRNGTNWTHHALREEFVYGLPVGADLEEDTWYYIEAITGNGTVPPHQQDPYPYFGIALNSDLPFMDDPGDTFYLDRLVSYDTSYLPNTIVFPVHFFSESGALSASSNGIPIRIEMTGLTGGTSTHTLTGYFARQDAHHGSVLFYGGPQGGFARINSGEIATFSLLADTTQLLNTTPGNDLLQVFLNTNGLFLSQSNPEVLTY